ncbi:unnamed protein product [Cuscuta epithymum]|uniref:Pectin acetylesterase n=1 Tax=Cuscuta epithymum TaxID=186058 RepID=A0AAV0C4R4_9ASTE|nr:unnamed protein product [Cuscuta epithymum]
MGFASKKLGEALLLFSLVTSVVAATLPNDGNPNSVNATLVKADKKAVCLLGNPAAYFYAPGYGNGIENWIIYLPGGGWCRNVSDCEDYIVNKGVGSNPGPFNFDGFGILSPNKEQNPGFYDWNRVFVRYCDASSWTSNSQALTANGTKLYFRGKRIFKAVMKELLHKGMRSAKNALLVGSSAGGVATTIYCDKFRSYFPATSTVKCFSDGAYFFLPKNRTEENTFLLMFKGLVKLHKSGSVLPKSCRRRLSAELCFFPPNLEEDITTPMFFLMSAFDRVQILYTLSIDLAGCVPLKNCTSNQIEASRELGSELLTVLPTQNKGYLITAPFAHTQADQSTWNTFPAAQTNETIAGLFGDWYFGRKSVEIIDKNPGPYQYPTSRSGA